MPERTRLAVPAAPVYLSSIGFALGDPVPIRDCPDQEVQRRLDLLAEQGVRYYRRSTLAGPALAANAANATLASLPARPPGLVVYCTGTGSVTSASEDLWTFLSLIGATSTPSLIVSGHACGNFGPGLDVAIGLLGSRRLTTALLVTVDRVPAGATRYLASGMTVLSDGAASCLIGADGETQDAFRIQATSFIVDGGQSPPTNRIQQARRAHAGIGRAVTEACAHAGVDGPSLRYLLAANHGEAARTFLAAASGLAPDCLYTPRVADVAHCFAADALINLSALGTDPTVQAGQLALVLCTSPRSWSATVVEYAGAGTPD